MELSGNIWDLAGNANNSSTSARLAQNWVDGILTPAGCKICALAIKIAEAAQASREASEVLQKPSGRLQVFDFIQTPRLQEIFAERLQ